MKKIACLFFIFLSITCFAQFSKTHYIPPLTAQNNLAGNQFIYISTPSTTNVNFKIIENGGNVIIGTVNNNNPYVYSIGQGNNTQLFTPKTNIGKISNKGYIIESEDLIYVSVRVNAGASGVGQYYHAGGLVSKGNSALGKEFRLGAMLNPLKDETLLNFASILSTENGTKVTISNIKNGTMLSDGTLINGPIVTILNKNESFVLAFENNSNTSPSNSSNIIGALVESDKPVVVNSGSFAGSNSTLIVTFQDGSTGPEGRDVGFDQIVPFEKTGKEYIFVKGIGTDELENVLLIAHKDQTKIYINDNTNPYTTLNKGQFIVINGSQFIDSNLYVSSSENVFAYQSIAGDASPANQNLFFVPPLNCTTPNIVDNIPLIESIGTTTYRGRLNIVTEIGASVSINNIPTSSTPVAITGNPKYVRYTINNLSGNISVKSTKQVYVSYFGTNNYATYGGYYSGFDSKPEITTDKTAVSGSSCIPNIILKVSTISSYDSFQWFFNNNPIPYETTNTYKPTLPGYYHVKATISACGTSLESDKMPVSDCPSNIDNDLANDNIDVDNDNDGILNCTESYGNQGINFTNPSMGVKIGDYQNSFTGTITTTGASSPSPNPFVGKNNGDFVTEIPIGKDNSVNYAMTFNKPISIKLEYVKLGNTNDLLNSNSEFIIKSNIDKTITVLNPNNQLLIDTNYDGIFESGITEYSSFEIRFRLNSTIPLAVGTGTFSFHSYLINSFSFTQKNLSDSSNNKATFSIIATCVPKDSDSDGIPDQLDNDSDNDGITDLIEAQINNGVALSNIDTNKDGLDDAFGLGIIPIDTDNDGVFDYLDLDSDNDGIFDKDESGSNAINADADNDGIKNYRELDSDNDSCNDVIEAGFTDADFDGILGNNPVTVNAFGVITSGNNGYTIPNSNYITAAPIVITNQPKEQFECELQTASFSISTNTVSSYQWQVSTNGNTWNNITNNTTYSGTTTDLLKINSITNAMNGYNYRVVLTKTGNTCGLISNNVKLNVYALPTINSPITLVQCDDDADGFSDFNLTEKNSFISSNYLNETFTYYTSSTGADANDPVFKITNPLAYKSANGSVWTRVKNQNGCFRVAQLDLTVSTTQIPSTFKRDFSNCDDYIDPIQDDKDGVATFDFSSVTSDIYTLLPSPNSAYVVKYYQNEADALSELNEITNTTNYRNVNYPNQQQIWVRVESTLENDCFGLGPHITLTVNPKPNIDTNESHNDDELICTNLPTFYVQLNAGIQDGSPTTNYTYTWTKDTTILTDETASTLDVNTMGIYTVEVKSLKGCSRTRTLKVTPSNAAHIETISIVDLSEENTITVSVTGQGLYEYSLDATYGPFQVSNVFDNVSAGIHEVHIIDKNGCGTVSKTIAVIGVPKFFTPNNDGHNDYWNIKGVNAILNSKSIIYIFDRYGKLLKQISPSSQGWDGTFVGQPLKADDYWYTVKLEDGREAKGHFTLKR